jgi:hypothetical protein
MVGATKLDLGAPRPSPMVLFRATKAPQAFVCLLAAQLGSD